MAAPKKRRTAAQIAATKRLVAANKKRRSVKRKTNPVTPSKTAIYRGVPTMKTNPIRKRKSSAKSASSGAVRKFSLRRRKNPISKLPVVDILQDSFFKSLVGAGGAIAVDVAANYIPVPDVLKTGYTKYLYKGLLSGLAGVAAGYVLNKQQAAQVAAGGLTVSLYGALTEFVKTNVPSLGLGYYNAALPATRANLGAYVSGVSTKGAGSSLQASAPGKSLGAYVSGSRAGQTYTGGRLQAVR